MLSFSYGVVSITFNNTGNLLLSKCSGIDKLYKNLFFFLLNLNLILLP